MLKKDEKLWNAENWWTSEYNYWPEVREGSFRPKKIMFHDSTLRDGEQTPGVVFQKDEKVEIAKLLDAYGVDRIEAGMPAVSQDDAEAIKEISGLGLKSKIMVFSRAMKQDIEKAKECGAWGIVLEAPSGLPKLRHQFNWTEDQLISRCVEAINYAKELGLFVNYFPFDTTRAEWSFLKRLVLEIDDKARPDSLTIVDTTGSCLPNAMYHLIRKIKELTSIPLEVHTHNDLGLGTATSLAAIEAGAEVVHGCINGLGERTGNASLEEVIMCLETLVGVKTNIKLEQTVEISRRIQEISKISVAKNKAIVGPFAFTREIGLGMNVIKETPLAVFPYKENLVGQKFNLVLGKKSGKESIKIKLEELGISASEEKIMDVLNSVKQKGIEKKAYLEQEEFVEIVNKII